VLRRCVWSRNIKNGCSIYIYDISRLRVKPHCHWDRPSWCHCKAVFLLFRFYTIVGSQFVGKISAICEINVFRVYNISWLDHVMSQINPIYMLFKSHLLICIHVSSNLIHNSVSTSTVTYPARSQTGRPIPILGTEFSLISYLEKGTGVH